MICTLQRYRTFTGDYLNYDGDVTEALAQAQTEIEERTERKFEQATRTETIVVRSNGRVYPSAYPVTAVSSPSDAVLDTPAVIVNTPLHREVQSGDFELVARNRFGSAHPYDWTLSPFVNGGPVTQAVTYTGGYATVPIELQRLNAEMAQYILAPRAPVGSASPASAPDLEGYSTPPLALLTDWPQTILRKINRWAHVKTKLPL